MRQGTTHIAQPSEPRFTLCGMDTRGKTTWLVGFHSVLRPSVRYCRRCLRSLQTVRPKDVAALSAQNERQQTGTTAPRVLNQKVDGRPPDAVYVGRPSRWGNPFKIGRDGDRDEVIRKYEAYLLGRPDLLAHLPDLRGKDLVCWCAPEACHADVLLRLANEGDGAP